MSVSIETEGGRTRFAPGEEIKGRASWDAPQPPEEVAVRLYWYTKGKGTQDHRVVETVTLPAPALAETRDFRIKAPLAPYSFSGKLISLIWGLRIDLSPGDEGQRLDVVISPNRAEVVLQSFEPST